MKAWRVTCLALLFWGEVSSGQKADMPEKAKGPSALHSKTHTNDALADTALLAWARHFTSNSASSIDIVTDAAIDDDGNVCVTGKSESPDAGRDYLTIKYDDLGREVWRARYDGPAHADDVPTALTVDAAGNVYVTGMTKATALYSWGLGWSYDFATVKYSSAGHQQWVAVFNGSGSGTDASAAIAVDAAGNVYVTGESVQADSSVSRNGDSDFATIKYSPYGTQLWAALYNGPNNSHDAARALALDDSGNVYVAGGSRVLSNVGYYSDFTILKYNADGVEQWAARITTDSTDGNVAAIAADNRGGVYITGTIVSWQSPWDSYIMTAKYNSAGQREWLRSYNKPYGTTYAASSLAIDHTGNVIIVGVGGIRSWLSVQGDFILTMKYSPAGDLMWTTIYRDRQYALLSAAELAVDASDNVYITGSSGKAYSGFTAPPFMADSIVTLKYDPNGVAQWCERYRGSANSNNIANAITVDRRGTVVVAGGSGLPRKSDFLTIKYHSTGNREWDVKATGEGTSFESLCAMTMDAAGNVYIAGSSISEGTSSDYVTVKFDANGNHLWSARYNSPDSGYDYPTAIVVDSSGSVFVTGSSRRGWGQGAYTTIKYDARGDQQWVGTYSAPQGGGPYLLDVDCSDNVYVAGLDGIVKYDRNGNQRWVYAGPVLALAVDCRRGVYLSTYSQIIKFDSTGTEQLFVPSPAVDIAIDDTGNVYTTLLYVSGYPNATRKYSPAGVLLWSLDFGGRLLKLDRFGNAFVNNGWRVSKINAAGAFEWYREIQSDWLWLPDFTIDESGNLFITGPKSLSLNWVPTFYVVKYNPSGVRQWSFHYNGPENPAETPYTIGIDGAGSVFVGGVTEQRYHSTKITLIKYSQATVPVSEDEYEIPLSYSLSQNYPNPFNPSTTISYSVPPMAGRDLVRGADGQLTAVSFVRLIVYDVLGREVATLVNEEKQPGAYTVQWSASGVASGMYFYRLTAGSFVETKKLLVLR
ncbi:MAG: T9SS type A sorting domain-containing protein [Bacteroidota bacterium]